MESCEANQPASTFYHKNGWREVRRRFDKDSGVNKVVFQKVTGRENREDASIFR